jgi:flagellum-specific peptidoglycan hydrolase FlgJ
MHSYAHHQPHTGSHKRMRGWQFVLALAVLAVLLIMQRTPTNTIISAAPGLSSSFTALNGTAPAAQAAASVPPAAAQAAQSTTGLSIVGAPSVTVAQIEAVLAEYRSPARGTGQAMYDLGVKYGIDPAFLLAFFIHESSAGTNPKWAGIKDDGSTTHNIGNIVCTTGWRCYGRFRDYPSWDAGIEDWYALMRDLYVNEWGRSTVEAIIPKYAPASDNNDEARYIAQIRTLVDSWRGK